MKDLTPFRDLLVSVDPKARKYAPVDTKGDYTTWTPGGIIRELADDADDNTTQRVYVDRYTRNDGDTIATALYDALNANYIPFEYERDYEADTRYIHHIFTCYI